MAGLRPTLINLCILVCFVTMTFAVDITMELMPGLVNPMTTQHCPNLAPGQCCRSLGIAQGSEAVHILHLHAMYLAMIWDQRIPNGNLDNNVSPIRGCSGRPAETRTGPGDWHFTPIGPQYLDRFNFGVHGASYIILPPGVPIDPTTSILQAAQGGIAAMWGGGKWFANHGASTSSIIPRSTAKRNIISALKGTYYWTTPPRWTWPTFVTVNGTQYTDNGVGNLEYQSVTGETLDLTSLNS